MIAVDNQGSVSFRVFLPHAARVEVVGDFTDWGRSRIPLQRQYPGWWTGSMKVEPGDHEFCYLIDGSIHLADYSAHGVKLDPGGKWVSTLRVSDGPSIEPKPSYRVVPAA
jgi:1,4-alpha-glucan branching enzyme